VRRTHDGIDAQRAPMDRDLSTGRQQCEAFDDEAFRLEVLRPCQAM